MSSLQIHHPEDGLLLRYIDGELPARKVRQVAEHLEACWQCRSEVEDLQVTVADCVRYRRNVLQACLPPPPNPWPDLYRDFARIDASLREEPWLARLKRALGGPLAFRWGVLRWGIALAAMLVVAVVVFQQLREAPPVHAATLLRKAVAAADAHPSVPRRILIQTSTSRMVKLAGTHQTARAAEPLAAALAVRLQAAHYDFDDPLSARTYQGWFDGLSQKQDEVTTVADPQFPTEKCFQIRTVTPDGSLAAASLMLRATDLEPVESKLEFRDREWVEFSEITDRTAPDGGLPGATAGEPSIGRTANSPSAAAVPGTPAGSVASVGDELEVLSALHEIGADLGDPVEVAISGGRVVVTGVGIPAQRQKQIHDALDAIPHVEIQFTEPASATLAAEPSAPAGASGASKQAGIQARVEQQVGGRAEFERFSAQVLDRNESMMSHAYALRGLAQRFPADREASLTPQERQLLREMAHDNASALLREASSIERTLTPILTAMGGSVAARPTAAQSAWEPSAEELFQSSRRVEVLVSVMLGAARGDGSTDRLPSELLSAIRELRADVDRCQELLGR
jgi:hypothetical protein